MYNTVSRFSYQVHNDIPDNKPSDEYIQSIMSKSLLGYNAIKTELLKRNANLSFVDEKSKKSILHYILESSEYSNNDKYKLIKLLLIHGAIVDYPDANNIRPLHLACKQQNEKLVKLLCKHGADVNSRDINFQTPSIMRLFQNSLNVHKEENLTKMMIKII